MGDFSWLHLSDLHISIRNSVENTLAKDHLLAFLAKKEIKCDYLFLTGDIAHQFRYDKSGEYLQELIHTVGLRDKKEQVFWAAGNHDINRQYARRNHIIGEIRNPAGQGGRSQRFLEALSDEKKRRILIDSGMREYNQRYVEWIGDRKDWKDYDIQKTHFIYKGVDVNIVVFNTCLTSFDDDDKENLFVMDEQITATLRGLDPKKPTIAIGHHGKGFLDPKEQDAFENCLNNRVDLYLCGHSHKLGYNCYQNTDNGIHEFTSGGGDAEDGYSKLTVLYGRYSSRDASVSLVPYSYSINIGDWREDYSLHRKLGQDNRFEIKRLRGTKKKTDPRNGGHVDEQVKADIEEAKQKACRASLFQKSKRYYDGVMKNDGRFSFVQQDALFADARIQTALRQSGEPQAACMNIMEWSAKVPGHALFVGEGGTGKTTSLLKLWEQRLQDEKKLPLYVPLHEYNNREETDFIKNYVESQYQIDLFGEEAEILLLLDGFNEIEVANAPVVLEIGGIMRRDRIQVVLTSRYDFSRTYRHQFGNLTVFEIQPLDEEKVLGFLEKDRNAVEPDLLSLLRNPMMLSLYANSQQKSYAGLFPYRENNRKAEIIYNYLLCQAGKYLDVYANAGADILSTLASLFYIAPYVANRIERKGLFVVDKAVFRNHIRACMREQGEEIVRLTAEAFREVFVQLGLRAFFQLPDELTIEKLLTRVFHMFITEDQAYGFRHQYFRDFLSALHLVNAFALERVKKNQEGYGIEHIPAEFRDRFLPPNITEMIGDYIGDYKNERTDAKTYRNLLHEIIDAMRNKKHADGDQTIRNVLHIMRKVRHDQIRHEDLGGLDFTGVSLNGIFFEDTSFKKSVIRDVCFLGEGHAGAVNCLAYSSDGRTLATASEDGSVRLWDGRTYQLLKILEGHEDGVNQVTYSPDGRRLATASEDGSVKLWDSRTYQLLAVLENYGGGFGKVIYSPDGSMLAMASGDGSVELWDSRTYQPLATLKGHKKGVNQVAYSPDGRVLAMASGDCVKLFDSRTYRLLATLEGHEGDVIQVAYSPNGNMLATASEDGSVKLWNSQTHQHLVDLKGHTRKVNQVAYSPDGSTLATASEDGSVKLWDSRIHQHLADLKGHTRKVNQVAYSPDGSMLASASSDGTVKLWYAHIHQLLTTLNGHTERVDQVLYSPDGSTLASRSSHETILWDAKTCRLRKTMPNYRGLYFIGCCFQDAFLSQKLKSILHTYGGTV